jgi:hypothetical protein
VQCCQQAKTHWVKAISRRPENIEGYQCKYAKDQDAFPQPNWPKRRLNELIVVTFTGRMIDRPDHPALARLIGARQSLA